ncbi:MAG TPA: hypothetical protein VIV40_31085 [Kofleriaceae bacterium]
MRWIGGLVMVVGSLACDKPLAGGPRWKLDRDAVVPDAVIDNQVTSARYLIDFELRGPEEGLNGQLETNITLLPRTAVNEGTTIVTMDVRRRSNGEVGQGGGPWDIWAQQEFLITSDAWDAGATCPCTEEYELLISREPQLDLPAIDVSGYVVLRTTGSGYSAPPSSELVATVAGPL